MSGDMRYRPHLASNATLVRRGLSGTDSHCASMESNFADDCDMKNLTHTLFVGGVSPSSLVADLGLTILRVFAGLSMAIAHGFGKVPPGEDLISGTEALGFPVPIVFAWGAALSESLGGLLLAAGFFTRPAALMILTTMCVAGFMVHGDDPYGKKELAFLYGAVALAFVCAGSGRLSLDALVRGGDKPKKP